jgi:hypothetical protein
MFGWGCEDNKSCRVQPAIVPEQLEFRLCASIYVLGVKPPGKLPIYTENLPAQTIKARIFGA